MTREERIQQAAERLAATKSSLSAQQQCLYDFEMGAEWADAHPQWISVEEQDIPLGQWVITYAPNEINYCKIDVELLAMDETAEDFGITHWMPLPQAPVVEVRTIYDVMADESHAIATENEKGE